MVRKITITKIIAQFVSYYDKKIHKIQVNNLNKLTSTLIKEIYKKTHHL